MRSRRPHRCGLSSNRPCSIKNLKALKRNATGRGYSKKPFWIKDGRRLGIIFPAKYGTAWWGRAKMSDIRRVMVV